MEGVEGREHFAFRIRAIAYDRGYPPAVMEAALERIDSADRITRGARQDMLRQAAFADYGPALREIVERLREGRGVAQDNLEAYYWALRADKADINLGDATEGLEGLLTEQQRTKARRLLTLGQFPRPWDLEE